LGDRRVAASLIQAQAAVGFADTQNGDCTLTFVVETLTPYPARGGNLHRAQLGDVHVQLIRTTQRGYVTSEDEHQVAAVPFTDR
jgi:hypothetical protein